MFDRVLNANLPNNLLYLAEGPRRSFSPLAVVKQENLGLTLPANSLDLHQTQKGEILD